MVIWLAMAIEIVFLGSRILGRAVWNSHVNACAYQVFLLHKHVAHGNRLFYNGACSVTHVVIALAGGDG